MLHINSSPEKHRLRCSLAGGQVVGVWLQRHQIGGIGGQAAVQVDVQCEREGGCPQWATAACPARRLDSSGLTLAATGSNRRPPALPLGQLMLHRCARAGEPD